MDFLFEVGLEEVPARMIAGAQAELQRRVVAMLKANSLLDPSPHTAPIVVRSFSTPRRLAVYISGVLIQQPNISLVSTGPSEKVAYKDGQPTPALEAFARRLGISVKDTYITDTPKGRYIAANPTKVSRSAADVIAEELPKELAGIYWAKNMTWLSPTGQNASGGGPVRAGRPERFVRPVRWLLALLGEVVVPVEFGGKTAGKVTRGHRVLAGDEAIPIGFPDEYEQTLLRAHVIADVEARRLVVRKALDKATRAAGAAGGDSDLRWREDEALLDTVTHLTEWPSVVLGSFEPEYLALPEEVLVTVMRDHQKYFAVEDAAGKLAPHFLAVLNTQADAAGEAVIRHGNERVLRARFNDARFFWEFDQRVPLVERVARLEKVTFQKDLGSYATKTERVCKLAASLAGLVEARGTKLDGAALETAARLAKTDLTTELVKEFTELQGQVGGLYARAQGFSAAVNDAIYDQYLPKSMEDAVPRTVEGALLAIADKVDTIVGMFGLGLEPTGSKDPFALRRAANGIVKILAANEIPLSIAEVVRAAASEFVDTQSQDTSIAERRIGRMGLKVVWGPDNKGNVLSKSAVAQTSLRQFMGERLEFFLREACGFPTDVVLAVNPYVSTDRFVWDTVDRARSVDAVVRTDDFLAISASSKRMHNILRQAYVEGFKFADVDPQLFTSPAERSLYDAYLRLNGELEPMLERRQYTAALTRMAEIRPDIDRFFSDVMVLVPEVQIRRNRLGLLIAISGAMGCIANFSKIVTAG
jgi:glycyl-tRNA synthetase beta chain